LPRALRPWRYPDVKSLLHCLRNRMHPVESAIAHLNTGQVGYVPEPHRSARLSRL